MSKASDQVVAGFMNLTSTEQAEAIKSFNEYLAAKDKKENFASTFKRNASLDLGPITIGHCPCCGK